MSLPIDRTAKSTLDTNLVNGNTSDAPVIKNSNDVVYNTIDELYNYTSGLVAGGALQPYPAFLSRQALINGGFDIWQRGTSFSTVGYNADRWYADLSNATVSRQSSGVPFGSKFCLRSTMTATGYCNIFQAFESLICSQLAGKTVTLSMKVRRNAAFTANLSVKIYKNTTPDTQTGGIWTEIANTTLLNSNIPTGTTPVDWSTISCSVTIPTDGTANGVYAKVEMGSTVPVGAYYEIAQAQLSVSNTPIPFQPRSFNEELFNCQRYYEKSYNYGIYAGDVTDPSGEEMYKAYSASGNGIPVGTFKVRKRVGPTVTIYASRNGASGNVRDLDAAVNKTVSVFGVGETKPGWIDAGATLTSGNRLIWHWVADAEL